MKGKDKELLIADLCGRLPYGVKCHINSDDTNTPRTLSRIGVDELDGILLDFRTDREDLLSIQVYLSEVKPYLRPMKSMTADEEKVFLSLSDRLEYDSTTEDVVFTTNAVDWLNRNHFDYRGLIYRGLALEAPEGMYEK